MGRHLKTGLNYFPLDVDFFEDEKVQFISAKFGVKGDGILLRILCKIYRQGYSLKFDEDAALLVARSVGDISLHGLVMDVVYESLKRGIFNNPIFLKFGLLTSKGIQSRYEKICTDSKRKDWQILPELDLIANTTELKAFTPEEIAKTPEESTQSKVKESKVKEIEEEAPPDFSGGNGQCWNVEEALKKSQKEFEAICMSAGKGKDFVLASLKKYHLFLQSKQEYPKPVKALFPGFQLWLLKEKNEVVTEKKNRESSIPNNKW